MGQDQSKSLLCLSESRLCCSYLMHGDFREIHLFVTMEKFCRQTADKWSKGVCTLQVKADPSSVSPTMGIVLFRLQLETRNKSVQRKEAVQGKVAGVSKQPRLHTSYTMLSVQMALHRTDQNPGAPGGKGSVSVSRRRGFAEHNTSAAAATRASGGPGGAGQAELKRIRPNCHRDFGKCLLQLCKHNRSQ